MEKPNTHRECLAWLAGREVECPVGNGVGIEPPEAAHTEICLCSGTGKVPRFPGLRKECSFCDGQGTTEKIPLGMTCQICKGRGWIPVDSLEATMKAIAETPYKAETRRVHRISLQTSVGHWSCDIEGENWTDWFATPNEAAVLALYEAVEHTSREGEG